MKKKFTYKALVDVALKKTQDFLTFFQTLSPFSRLFQVWKMAAKFQDFFKNS